MPAQVSTSEKSHCPARLPSSPGPFGAPFCYNTLLCIGVTSVQFESAHFAITGSSGQIIQTTFQPEYVFMNIATVINGEQIELGGSGRFGAEGGDPPRFASIEICGAPRGVGGSCSGIRAGVDQGYDVILFAVPESVS